MVRYKKYAGYFLFFAMASGIFLYVCFPSETIRQYLEASARKFNPALALKVQRIHLAFPFGLELENTRVSLKDRPGISLFKADSFVIKPSIQTVVLRKPALSFSCETYGGRLQGVMVFKGFNLQGPVQSNVYVSDVRLGQYPFEEWLERDLTGAMSGTVTFLGSHGSFIRGSSGKGDLSIKNGSIRFTQPFLGIESVDFQHIDTKVLLEKEEISISYLNFRGKQMEGSMSGSIHLKRNLARSTLNLKVVVNSSSPLSKDEAGLFRAAKFLERHLTAGNFKVAIRGTLAQPRISFL